MTLQHRRKEEEEEEEAEFVSSSSSSSSSSRFLSPLASSLPDGASALPVPDARISLNYLERFVKSKKKRTKMGFFLLLLLLLREGEHKFLAHCIISFLFPGGQKFRRWQHPPTPQSGEQTGRRKKKRILMSDAFFFSFLLCTIDPSLSFCVFFFPVSLICFSVNNRLFFFLPPQYGKWASQLFFPFSLLVCQPSLPFPAPSPFPIWGTGEEGGRPHAWLGRGRRERSRKWVVESLAGEGGGKASS